jgi:hypothetical protein
MGMLYLALLCLFISMWPDGTGAVSPYTHTHAMRFRGIVLKHEHVDFFY